MRVLFFLFASLIFFGCGYSSEDGYSQVDVSQKAYTFCNVQDFTSVSGESGTVINAVVSKGTCSGRTLRNWIFQTSFGKEVAGFEGLVKIEENMKSAGFELLDTSDNCESWFFMVCSNGQFQIARSTKSESTIKIIKTLTAQEANINPLEWNTVKLEMRTDGQAMLYLNGKKVHTFFNIEITPGRFAIYYQAMAKSYTEDEMAIAYYKIKSIQTSE
ncbi:hypothetical protein [Treponema sp.]|uniref:hypothetical protein n=1 Tax=Treponema sp. TaxID=166 RepID=UPI003F08105C